MDKEEILNKYIDLIDKGYCSDCNELNCIDNFPHAKITHAIRELQQENQELKKQLTTYQILHRDCKVDNLKNISKIEEMENQQKEFIKYLENEYTKIQTDIENEIDNNIKYFKIERRQAITGILQKYKEMIGVPDDKTN